MKVLYLDESGDHSLVKIDPQYPVFVLGGIIVDRAYDRMVLGPRLKQLKRRFLGRDDVILRSADIARARSGFEALKDQAVRGRFYAALNAMMEELEYEVVACAIRKDQHLAKHRAEVADPYEYCLQLLVERFCLEMGDVADGGLILAEKRGTDLDLELERAWAGLIRRGTSRATARQIGERIVDLGLKDKRLNVAGLQLADLVVSTIGRALAGKRTHEDWTIVRSKFRRWDDDASDAGLIVLPR